MHGVCSARARSWVQFLIWKQKQKQNTQNKKSWKCNYISTPRAERSESLYTPYHLSTNIWRYIGEWDIMGMVYCCFWKKRAQPGTSKTTIKWSQLAFLDYHVQKFQIVLWYSIFFYFEGSVPLFLIPLKLHSQYFLFPQLSITK